MTDVFAWLPLHYACANGASEDVLRVLANAFPASKTSSDKRGRTPLHFALANTKQTFSPAIMAFLASTGATACRDENGMLPLHYACAYGISRDALQALTTAFPESIAAIDKKGRTPLHFAMGNADRNASPSVVKLLLHCDRETVNTTDNDGQLPLHLLSTQAHKLTNEAKKDQSNAQQCLEFYLGAEPRATADFFTALQSLPTFLCEQAVVTPHIQEVLNTMVSKRFPTMILMMDFYFIMMIILFFRLAVGESIDIRFADYGESVNPSYLAVLYIGASYFLSREIIQMWSLVFQRQLKTWFFDMSNYLDILSSLLVFFWTFEMQTNIFSEYENINDYFRVGTAITTGILWMLVLSFLKSTLIDFAVFVGGVFYVVRRLAAFFIALTVIMVAFAQMFYTVYQQTDECTAESSSTPPWCHFWTALIKVYTMLLGEVDETDFIDNLPALFFFVVFLFLVVILLANVLIAIVTDSYGVIKNERAQIVFWSNRLDFVAEMHLMSSGPWTDKVRSKLCCGNSYQKPSNNGKNNIEEREMFGRDAWKSLFEIYQDQSLRVLSVEFWAYLFLRASATLIIPIWLLVGLFPTAGWLWPPQVREYLMVQRSSKREQIDSPEEQRIVHMKALKADVHQLQDNIMSEMRIDRKEVSEIKNQLTEMKNDMTTQMRDIKEIMAFLFEQQAP